MFHFKKNKRDHALHEGRERVISFKKGLRQDGERVLRKRKREGGGERLNFARAEGKGIAKEAREVMASFIAG